MRMGELGTINPKLILFKQNLKLIFIIKLIQLIFKERINNLPI